MKRRHKAALLDWLEAERRGTDRQAEQALAGLWRGLGRPAPSPGFARRTLARAAVPGRAPRRWRLTVWRPSRASRGALAAALSVMAVSLAAMPVSLVKIAPAAPRLAATAVGLVATFLERLAHGLTAWSVASRISESLVAALTAPTVLATLGAALLMSLFAFGWLTQLLTPERRARHA